MGLQKTASLITASSRTTDIEKQRGRFLAAYAEMDSVIDYTGEDFAVIALRTNFLTTVANAAFAGLDQSLPLVALYRRAALEIAGKIDKGEDGTQTNPYHNRLHFAKVAVNFRALAENHNSLVRHGIVKDRVILNDAEIAMGLLAAVAHDIKHDGIGNIVKGVHTRYRLEQKSIDQALEWAVPKDSIEKLWINEALSLIRATDISTPFAGMPSPAYAVRSWHDRYLKGYSDDVKPVRLSLAYPELIPLTTSFSRALQSALLQDADVFSSVIAIRRHEKETARFAEEAARTGMTSSPLFFLEGILRSRTTTTVARRLADPFIKGKIAALKDTRL
jgi:hypothetical protein